MPKFIRPVVGGRAGAFEVRGYLSKEDDDGWRNANVPAVITRWEDVESDVQTAGSF